MYVSQSRKMIFLAHPRTASRAVVAALHSVELEHLGFEPHPSTDHHDPLTEHPGPGWTVFTVVRNHFDAWVSWQAFNSKTAHRSLQATIIWTMQHSGYFPENERTWALHCKHADTVLRYETLQADMTDLLRTPVELPYIGRSERPTNYRDAYDASARSYVELRFGHEMDELGYSW